MQPVQTNKLCIEHNLTEWPIWARFDFEVSTE